MRTPATVLGALALAMAQPEAALAQAASGLETQPVSVFRFGLLASGGWDDNAYFRGPAGEESSWSTTGQASLGWERRFRTGGFSLSGFGGVLYYPEIDGLNQPTYGGSLGLTWAPSRRTTFQLSQSYSRTNTRYLSTAGAAAEAPERPGTPPAPGDGLPQPVEGPPLPTSSVDYFTTAAGLEQRLSRRWQLGLDASYSMNRFDEDALVEGEQVYASVRIGRQVGPRGLLYLGYGFSNAWFETGKERGHQLLLGGRKQPPTRGVGFELAGGVGYLESTEEYYPAGRAGLTAVGRHASLSLLYHRDFGQAYGYGRQTVGDLATATLGWFPGRRISFNAGYNFAYRRDPSDEGYTIVSGIATAGFSWDVGAGFYFGSQYSWERNETEGLPVVEGSRVSASLSWGVDWR